MRRCHVCGLRAGVLWDGPPRRALRRFLCDVGTYVDYLAAASNSRVSAVKVSVWSGRSIAISCGAERRCSTGWSVSTRPSRKVMIRVPYSAMSCSWVTIGGIIHRVGEKTPTAATASPVSLDGQRGGGAPHFHRGRIARLKMRATRRGGANSTRTLPRRASADLRSRASNRGAPSPSSSRTKRQVQ